VRHFDKVELVPGLSRTRRYVWRDSTEVAVTNSNSRYLFGAYEIVGVISGVTIWKWTSVCEFSSAPLP